MEHLRPILSWAVTSILLLQNAFADGLAVRGKDQNPVSLTKSVATSPYLEAVKKGVLGNRFQDLVEKSQKDYPCPVVGGDPVQDSKVLQKVLSAPRTQMMRNYQFSCWNITQSTIEKLKKKNPSEARALESSFEEHRSLLQIQQTVENCPGGDSEIKSKLLQQLAYGKRPLEDMQRFSAVPVSSPLNEEKASIDLRRAIYSEGLALTIEQVRKVEKQFPISQTSSLVDKVCPPYTTCGEIKEPRVLSSFLKSIDARANSKSVSSASPSQAFLSLQKEVGRINQVAKKFNEEGLKLSASTVQMTASHWVPKKSSEETKALNNGFYETVDEVRLTEFGFLLDQEPLKGQIKNIYSGIPIKKNGVTQYIFASEHNKNASAMFDRLPDNLKISGGGHVVIQAAKNSAQNSVEFGRKLTKIETDIKNNDGSEWSFLGSEDKNAKGLALMMRLNPEATARVLMMQPEVAKAKNAKGERLICSILEKGRAFEREEKIEGQIQLALGLSSLAAAGIAMVIPSGVTQPVGAGLAVVGVGLSAGSVGMSLRQYNRQSELGELHRLAASAQPKELDHLKKSREEYSKSFTSMAEAVVGAADVVPFMKGFKAGKAWTAEKAKVMFDKMRALKSAGSWKLGEKLHPEALGRLLSMIDDPEELARIEKAIATDPKKFESIFNKVGQLCPAM